MKKIAPYITSFRLKTLPLAVAGIALGTMLAAADGYFHTGIFAWAMLTAISLQILSNLANELGDLQKGTDNERRLGPIRSVQGGKITPKELTALLWVFGVLSGAFGGALVWSAFGTLFSVPSAIMLILGVLAIVAAIKYTFGRGAYGYLGWGDVFVFLFFGLVSVSGVYFLITKSLSASILLPASSVGFLATAMLNQNNMRDLANDADFEKNTLVVRMGLQKAKLYHTVLIAAAFVCMTIFCLIRRENGAGYLYLLSLPVFAWHIRFVYAHEGRNLDKHMKVIALSTILFALLAGMGVMI